MDIWDSITDEDNALVTQAEAVNSRSARKLKEAWEELAHAIAKFEAMKFVYKLDHGTPEERRTAEDELGRGMLKAAMLRAAQQKAQEKVPKGAWDPDTTN